MWLLVVTVCLAWSGEVECRQQLEYRPSKDECKEVGRLYRELYEARDQPRARVVFVGVTCKDGQDT